MASGNFSSNTGTNLNLYITWSSTTNVSTNTSTVTVNVYSRSYTINGNALADSYVTVNGNTKSMAGISLSQSVTNLTNKLLTTHTVAVPHNSNGTKSITIKANVEFNGTVSGKYLSDITASQTVTLDTIPRASNLSVPTTVNTGSSLTATITPASSSFTHKVAYIIGNSTMFTSGTIAAGTNAYAYTIPHSWLPSANSVDMVVRLFTYSGSTEIGRIDKPVSVSVPTSVVPTVSNLTATIVNGLGGYYVEGKSQVRLAATATAGSGSTLSSYVFTGQNISGNSSTLTSTTDTVTSSIIRSVGNLTYSVVAKDNRPNRQSAPKTVTINVNAYSNPQITSITAQRCLADGTIDNDGTYAKVTVKATHSSVSGANKRKVTLYSSKDNYATGTVVLAESNTSDTYTGVYGSGFATGTNYTIRAVITDTYNTGTTINKTVTLAVSERTFNIAKYGNGLAIGGLSTVSTATDPSKFECNWPTYLNDSLWVNNGHIQLAMPGAEQIINFRGGSSKAWDVSIYKGSSASNTVLGIWDGTNNSSVWVYDDLKKFNINIPTKVVVDNYATFVVDKDNVGPYIMSSPAFNRKYSQASNLYIASGGMIGCSTSSSERYKTEITENISEDLNPYKILDIPVKQYKYNKDNIPIDKTEDDVYIGLIAEDVEKAYPAAAEYTEDGQVEMWNIKVLFPALLKIVQDQQKEINALKQRLKN